MKMTNKLVVKVEKRVGDDGDSSSSSVSDVGMEEEMGMVR